MGDWGVEHSYGKADEYYASADKYLINSNSNFEVESEVYIRYLSLNAFVSCNSSLLQHPHDTHVFLFSACFDLYKKYLRDKNSIEKYSRFYLFSTIGTLLMHEKKSEEALHYLFAALQLGIDLKDVDLVFSTLIKISHQFAHCENKDGCSKYYN